MNTTIPEKVITSRNLLKPPRSSIHSNRKEAAEGGCGVIGMASNEKIPGRHLLQSLIQMRNRGNGKGGGISAVGLEPSAFGVTKEVLDQDYLITLAYLDSNVREEVENDFLSPTFIIDHVHQQTHIEDYNRLLDLDVMPPEVFYYFVRVKTDVESNFRRDHDLHSVSKRQIEDEIVYQNTFRLNTQFYASTGETRAFVLSHGKNLIVLKMVGYGDDVVRYYQLEDLKAHIWIGHHRYPTKGRVWHPGGAHPFVGLNEALVHNGDFANYASITEYLEQRGIYPLFLTDTEVSVQVFDLLHRIYQYPLEYVIEALAPTTERDFTLLTEEKKHVYQMLQTTHIHSSPDGPWFFLIAQSSGKNIKPDSYRLIGITDTSMLRPQVFALQSGGENSPSIGFAASEKQAIDAALESLSMEDQRFWPKADHYWNARGGSHTDGGAFIFSVEAANDNPTLVCRDKFGQVVRVDDKTKPSNPHFITKQNQTIRQKQLPDLNGSELLTWFIKRIQEWNYLDLHSHLTTLSEDIRDDTQRTRAIKTLTQLLDRRYPTGDLRRSSLVAFIEQSLNSVFDAIQIDPTAGYEFATGNSILPEPMNDTQRVVVDASSFDIEGEASLARALVELAQRGFSHFILANTKGHRFIGNGFGPNSKGIRIDVYGSSGDYLASGLDGMEIYVHGSGQDQLAQIMKSGKLVVHGDVGQTFGYAAKGGQAYILGNAAGRPMINAVGKPRIVINGTCLDYLAESFMAGDPFNGGGFVILNGVQMMDDGEIIDLEEPYPGGNLFSLASGGAIYVRDPEKKIRQNQLNGGELSPITPKEWSLIKPYLEENSRQFGISIKTLLNGESPERVYRVIRPKTKQELLAEEAWIKEQS